MARRGTSNGSAGVDGSAAARDLEAIEREHVEQLARAHAELAAAQDRAYWLDRWGLDLNVLMRRPAARRLRALLRWLRELKRARLALQRYVQARIGDLRKTATEDEIAAAATEERVTKAGAGTAAGDGDPTIQRS